MANSAEGNSVPRLESRFRKKRFPADMVSRQSALIAAEDALIFVASSNELTPPSQAGLFRSAALERRVKPLKQDRKRTRGVDRVHVSFLVAEQPQFLVESADE